MLHKGLSSIGILAVLPDALICATCDLVKPFPLICVVYAMVRGIYKGEEGGKGGKERERMEVAGKMQEGGREAR